MTLKSPALDPMTVEPRQGSAYPPVFRPHVAGREKRVLGDALGLSNFGVNLVTLAPGSASALRHWHKEEDEFIFVLDGEVVLVTDSGEQVLKAGHCAGFPKGKADGHQVINRSPKPARYLEVGDRRPGDSVTYPDDDLRAEKGTDGQWRMLHKDGQPY